MITSPAGKALIKRFENCALKAYPDPMTRSAPWTCGWGTTRGVTPDTVWTQEEADAQFDLDIAETEAAVMAHVTAPMTQGQFDAFVSIFHNVGPGRVGGKSGIGVLTDGRPSTLLAAFNAGDLVTTQKEWVKWISPGTRVSRGLLRRRLAELNRFRA